MPDQFVSLMTTIAVLATKDRNKEETLAYMDFLRYAASLARLNQHLVDAEIHRIDEDTYNGDQSQGNSTKVA